MSASPSAALPDGPTATKLRGIVAAAVTPVTADLGIDVPRLVAHLRWLLATGCDLVSVFGTTGEGPSFSVEARCAALREIVAAGIPRQRLLPAAMATAPLDTRRLVDAAAALGCRAVLILPPFYYPSDGPGVARFLDAALGREPAIDLVLYHIPALARLGFDAGLIDRLLDRHGARLAGIKDSTGEPVHTLGLARRFPGIAVFTGTDPDLLPLLAAGGAGIIGGIPNVNARALRALIDAPEEDRAELMRRIGALFDAVVAYGGPMPIKTLVAHQHRDDAWLRTVPPHAPQLDRDRAALIDRFVAAGFSFESGLA